MSDPDRESVNKQVATKRASERTLEVLNQLMAKASTEEEISVLEDLYELVDGMHAADEPALREDQDAPPVTMRSALGPWGDEDDHAHDDKTCPSCGAALDEGHDCGVYSESAMLDRMSLLAESQDAWTRRRPHAHTAENVREMKLGVAGRAFDVGSDESDRDEEELEPTPAFPVGVPRDTLPPRKSKEDVGSGVRLRAKS